MSYRVLDLFSGIGGFSLGLERTGGFKTVAFCEIDPFCRRVLAKHWPEVPCYDDVRTLTAARLAGDGIGVDVICGGFPCQDISFAGIGAGIAEGTRSGLWTEIARLVGVLRPVYVVLENVDAEWHCIPASVLGAPHRRDRWWCVAYPAGERRGETGQYSERQAEWFASGRKTLAHAYGQISPRLSWGAKAKFALSGIAGSHVADAASVGCVTMVESIPGGEKSKRAASSSANCRFSREREWWSVEPDVGRVADGVPDRVDRLRALGNAVVPQIPELIGRAILAAEANHAS